MDLLPLTDVKTRLSNLVDQVNDDHEPVVVTKHGRPVAALIPIAEFDRLYGAIRLVPEAEK
jgi:prevent-host-death family protein